MKAPAIFRQGLQNLCVVFGRGENEIRWALEKPTSSKRMVPGGVALIRYQEIHTLGLKFRRGSLRNGICVLRRRPAVDDRAHPHRPVFRVSSAFTDHSPTDYS